jgi:hypothetical protein
MQAVPNRGALVAVGLLIVVIPSISGCVGVVSAVGAMIAAETIDYGNTPSPKEPEIVGYCYDKSRSHAYSLWANSYYGGNYGKCATGDSSISKSEYDRIIADQSRAYCVKAKSDQLYRSTSTTCLAGDTRMTQADWEALARNHATPAVL